MEFVDAAISDLVCEIVEVARVQGNHAAARLMDGIEERIHKEVIDKLSREAATDFAACLSRVYSRRLK